MPRQRMSVEKVILNCGKAVKSQNAEAMLAIQTFDPPPVVNLPDLSLFSGFQSRDAHWMNYNPSSKTDSNS